MSQIMETCKNRVNLPNPHRFISKKYVGISELGQRIAQYPSRIKYVEEPSIVMMMDAVRRHGYTIKHIPHEKQTKEMKLVAVSQHGYSIQFIKDPSEEICMAAVERHGYAIQYIDKPSLEVRKAAILTCANSIFLIEPSQITYELCKVAIIVDPHIIQKVLDFADEHQIVLTDAQVVHLEQLAIDTDPISIKRLKCQRPELCMRAIKNHPNAIVLIREQYVDSKMVVEALRRNPLMYREIAPKYHTPEIDNMLLDIDAAFLNLIARPTDEMYIKAIKSKPLMIDMIPFPNEKMYIEAIKGDPRVILNARFITDQMVCVMIKSVRTEKNKLRYPDLENILLKKIKGINSKIFESMAENGVISVKV